MKSRNVAYLCKNAVGTVFLLAGAFFVCSTLVSMRAVFADPIAPVVNETVATAAPSPRTGASRTNTRTNPRANVVATTAPANATVARTAARTNTSNAAAARSVATRGTTARATARTNTAARSVAQRANTSTRANATANRVVRSRVSTMPGATAARVSLSGSAIRGSKASTQYTYLSSKLYTGNYSNIIDPQTGLISADAYNNCMESYYTCMDEICTARNAAQRRCACAGRVKGFAEAETALESANEELIKVSGELALLIANKGKDVSQAFQLTDAEKVMNCVSWRDASKNGTATSDQFGNWCDQHGFYDSAFCSATTSPEYCRSNTFGFDIKKLDGSGSDILASLQSWANAKDQTLTIITDDTKELSDAFGMMSGIVSGMAGISGALASSDELQDSLAKTWGYDLFAYAHNNVCSRVLDSCFNGIYETCGTPASGICASTTGMNSSRCAYNYNSRIEVSSNGDVKLNERGKTVATDTASCLGYTSSSGDPYSTLRGPVADARRSILQKYLLDANADCDAYGEQLRTAAQNIGYQKVAAQQALQQKRLEFAQEEANTIASDFRNATTNFNECLSELYDCYTTQESANRSWSTSRIKTYCAQVANVPHCYEDMVCGAPNNKLQAVITKDEGKTECKNEEEFEKNTCRNVVTLSEILNASYAADAPDGSSAKMREQCLKNIDVDAIRDWKATTNSDDRTNWSSSTSD